MTRRKNKAPELIDTANVEDVEPESIAEEATEQPQAEPETLAEPQPEPKPTEKTTDIVEKEAVTYIGPTLPGGKLSRYSTFRNGLPVRVGKLVEECKALKTLLVPVSKLAASQQKLADRSSVQYARFAEVRKHFNKGAK